LSAVRPNAVPVPSWLSPTQRSLLAEMELQANRYGSPLQTTLLWSGSEPAGTVHIYERRAGMWRTGIYDGAVLLSSEISPTQTLPGPDALAPALLDVDAVTLRIVRAGGPAQAENRPIAEGKVQPYKMQEVIPLADTYEGFLKQLGKHTRRNIVHSRNLARREGLKFSFSTAASWVNSSKYSSLAERNMPSPTKLRRLLKMIRFLAAQPRPFQAHLGKSSDKPFSITGGFIEGDLALMTYQLNDRVFRDLSPSLMMRSYLVEELIERGVRYLAFVGGCAGLLYHQCMVAPTTEVLLVRRTFLARTKYLASRMLADPKHRIVRLSPQFFTFLCVAGNSLSMMLDPISA
jgi:hypothetical protein